MQNGNNNFRQIALQLIVLVGIGAILSLVGKSQYSGKGQDGIAPLLAVTNIADVCGTPTTLKNPNASLFVSCGGFIE